MLKKQRSNGIRKKLVVFEMIDRGISGHVYTSVDKEGLSIGVVSPRTQSPSLQRGIGKGYANQHFAKAGSEIFMKKSDKNLNPMVVERPLLKSQIGKLCFRS